MLGSHILKRGLVIVTTVALIWPLRAVVLLVLAQNLTLDFFFAMGTIQLDEGTPRIPVVIRRGQVQVLGHCTHLPLPVTPRLFQRTVHLQTVERTLKSTVRHCGRKRAVAERARLSFSQRRFNAVATETGATAAIDENGVTKDTQTNGALDLKVLGRLLGEEAVVATF